MTPAKPAETYCGLFLGVAYQLVSSVESCSLGGGGGGWFLKKRVRFECEGGGGERPKNLSKLNIISMAPH